MATPGPDSTARIFAAATAQAPVAPTELAALAERCADDMAARIGTLVKGAGVAAGKATAGNLGALIAAQPEFGIVLVARTVRADAPVVVQLETAEINGCIDLLLGGSGAPEVRKVSAADVRLCRLLLEPCIALLGKMLTAAEVDAGLAVEAAVTEMAKAPALRQLPAGVRLELRISTPDAATTVAILLPDTWVAPLIAGERARGAPAEAAPTDNLWSSLVEQKVAAMTVGVEAVMEVSGLDLGDVSRWAVGQVIQLAAKRDTLVRLESAAMPLAMCELGRHGEHLVLRVSHRHDEEQELRDDLIEAIVSSRQA